MRTVFDRQDRAGPAVFVSEYAITDQNPNGGMRGAAAEAAFMTGAGPATAFDCRDPCMRQCRCLNHLLNHLTAVCG
jgi:hypothetical protein